MTTTRPDVRPGTLAASIAKGIERGLRDMGAELSGCTPSMLSGWVIRELKQDGQLDQDSGGDDA